MLQVKRWVIGAASIALLAAALPATANAQLWYNGNWNANANLASERNTTVSQAMVYDNFVVTGSGWTLTTLFGEYLSDVAWTTADYEIRSGVSAGNGGSLLFSGSGVAAARAATGRNGLGFDEYRATISGLNIFLGAGTYWLGISPVGSGSGRAFATGTDGTNGVNTNLDNDAFFNSSYFGANFSENVNFEVDYTYGVDGRLGGGEDVVPEPATMTLLATGLLGMAANRRRRKAPSA